MNARTILELTHQFVKEQFQKNGTKRIEGIEDRFGHPSPTAQFMTTSFWTVPYYAIPLSITRGLWSLTEKTRAAELT